MTETQKDCLIVALITRMQNARDFIDQAAGYRQALPGDELTKMNLAHNELQQGIMIWHKAST